MSDELRASDLDAVREQLGREPTVPFSVVARCTGGHPFVIRNRPIDERGEPFPTIYWLTCPAAVKAVSRLESEGWIARLNDPELAGAIEAAHRAYAAEREETLEGAGAWGGVGGARAGMKCLHAHYAYHLAGGDDAVGRWTADRVDPIHPEEPRGRVAAIDQGTNSTRLLVLEPTDHSDPIELARDMVITRLGRGVDRDGRLDPASIERALAAIGSFTRRARALHADRIRLGATSAVRDAANRDEFLDRVRELGVEPEVIDGRREAELSFLGGTRGLDPMDGPFVVMDIGGGSTEFVVGHDPGVAEDAISVQIGSVRLTERVAPGDPPTEDELREFARIADGELARVEAEVPVTEARRLVAVAGTATTLQACALGLERYDPDLIHRSTLTLADAERTVAELAAMTNEERAAIPVMPKGRGDVIVAGATILVTAMQRFGFAEALISETDILDGLAFELLGLR